MTTKIDNTMKYGKQHGGFNETIALASGESALVEVENPTFLATQTSDILLFITQTTAGHFDGGMYSGNLHS